MKLLSLSYVSFACCRACIWEQALDLESTILLLLLCDKWHNLHKASSGKQLQLNLAYTIWGPVKTKIEQSHYVCLSMVYFLPFPLKCLLCVCAHDLFLPSHPAGACVQGRTGPQPWLWAGVLQHP